ncbi:MAG: HEAT repeat domain-containing protein, partial [Anaerolineaceae bacterium]|nr:HEAT repeat domain-containing protein [Anaerolineaceae bacterium]
MPKSKIPIEQLLADLHDADFMARSDAARELGKSGNPRAVAALLPNLNDPDWRVRRNAVQALGGLKAKAAVGGLIAALEDRTLTVRTRAAVALGRIKDPGSIQALLVALQPGDGRVSESAAQALKKFGKAAIPAIKAELETTAASSRQDKEKLCLLEILAELRCVDALDGLVALLDDADSMVRWRVLMALANLPDQRARQIVIGVLSSSDPLMRIYAAQAVARMNDPIAAAVLVGLLKDPVLSGLSGEVNRAVTGALQVLAHLPKEYAGVIHN